MANAKDKSRKARRRLFIETIIIFLVIASPFLFKAHEYLPSDPDETISFLGLEIDRNGFADLNTYFWWLLGKIIPLYLLTIWFFTCRHWWYHILLIPICMYAFQIFEVVYSDNLLIDVKNVLWLLPVCMVIIPFVYFVRIKLYDKHVHGIDLEAMDAELQYYKNKEKDELKKAGINIPEEPLTSAEEDLSQKTPNRVMDNLVKQLRHSFKSLF